MLQLTQMLAPNGEAFAVAQGPLSIGGYSMQAGERYLKRIIQR